MADIEYVATEMRYAMIKARVNAINKMKPNGCNEIKRRERI